MTVPQVLRRLNALARRRARAQRAGASGGSVRSRAPRRCSPKIRLPLADLVALAQDVGRDHDVACGLWEVGSHDARVLATLVADPDLVEDAQLDRWIQTAGEVALADRVALSVAAMTSWARSKVGDWAHHPQPEVRRAAYLLLAELARSDGEMTDADFIPWVDAAPACVPREHEGVCEAVASALAAIAGRNPALRQRVAAATARLERAASEAGSGGAGVRGRSALPWRRAG